MTLINSSGWPEQHNKKRATIIVVARKSRFQSIGLLRFKIKEHLAMISSKILQATWNLETGQSIEFKLHSEYVWTQWQMYRQHAPFTEQDLISVVRHLKSQVKTGKRRPECLRFSTLIGDPTVFEEAMQFVRQHNTNPKNTPPTERQRVLAATGRTEMPKSDAVKTPATELSKLGAMMKAWRENGGLG